MAKQAESSGRSVAREKRRMETLMIFRQPILAAAIIAVILLLLIFVIYPLLRVFAFSFSDENGNFSTANLISILTSSRYLSSAGRTLLLGLVVALISTFIGYIFAADSMFF